MHNVLIIGSMHERGLELLRAREDISLDIVAEENVAEVRAKITAADAVAVRTAPLRAELLDRCAKLKVVSRHGVGYDSIDVDALTRRGIPLTIAVGANAVSVAEHALFLMLSLAKRGLAYDRATRSGAWAIRNTLQPMDLCHKKLLIVGLGRIGRLVAARCRALQMELTAFDPHIPAEVFERHGCRRANDLQQALKQADVVTLHFPGGGANLKFIGRDEIAAMRPGALLINCARGDVLDEAALYQALRDGRLRGAGLDVFVEEPSSADNPLFGLDNVVVSPHSAALTEESAIRMAETTLGNVLDALDGKLNPAMVVNKAVLQRS